MKKFFFLVATFFVALTASTAVATNSYYYRSNQTGWGNDDSEALTVSEDGYYEYFATPAGNCECKIYTSAAWDGEMGEDNNQPGFNNTNIGNCVGSTWTEGYHNADYWFDGGEYYILVYYPNTAINDSEKPIICASTILPNGALSRYGVAGAPVLCGSSWDPSDTNNDMTETTPGVFSITYSDVELAESTYKFKVAKRHAWECGAYPENDYELVITESGKYDVTITFTESNEQVAAVADLITPLVILPTINLGGAWYTNEKGDWLKGDDFVPAEGNETASTTIHFDTPADYGFKVIVNDSWQSKPKDEKGNNYRFHRKWKADNDFSAENADAMILAVDKPGDYEFTWTYATGMLSIKFPDLDAYTVTLSSATHINLSVKNEEIGVESGTKIDEFTELTVSASVNDAAYRVKSLRAYETESEDPVEINDGKLTMPSCAITIVAEEGAHVEDGYYLTGTFDGVSAWDLDDMNSSKRFVINPENDKEYKLLADLKVDDHFKVRNVVSDAFVHYYPGGFDDDYWVDADHAGNGKTIYFRPDGEGGEGWHWGVIYIDKNDPTAVENAEAEVKAVKSIENGQIVIIKNGVKYNVVGAVVK